MSLPASPSTTPGTTGDARDSRRLHGMHGRDSTGNFGHNKENERSLSTVSTNEPLMTSLKKKAVPPTPSILDFMSDAEVKRLTKANTRKNIGERRKTFRSPFSRRRVDNLPLPFHEQDDCPATIQAIPVVDYASPKPTTQPKNLSSSPRSSLAQPKSVPLVDVSSPVTPANDNSQTPFAAKSPVSKTVPSPLPSPSNSTVSSSVDHRLDCIDEDDDKPARCSESDLTIEPAPEAVAPFEPTSAGLPTPPRLPPTMSLAPSYQKKLMENGNFSTAWAVTSNVVHAVSGGSAIVRPPRSVRICSRVKVVDYLKHRPISPSSSFAKPPPRSALSPPSPAPVHSASHTPTPQYPAQSAPQSPADLNNTSPPVNNDTSKEVLSPVVPESALNPTAPTQLAPMRRFLLKSTSVGSSSNGGSKIGCKGATGILSGACEKMSLFLPGRKKVSPAQGMTGHTDVSALNQADSNSFDKHTRVVARSTSASAVLPCPRPDARDGSSKAAPQTDNPSSVGAYGRRAEEVRKLRAQVDSLVPSKLC